MKKEVLLTTTTSLPNYEISESKGLVFANVVLGTNFFSDFAASITDTFGGTSDTYQSKLDKIYSEVVDKLKKKVLDLGCNAIIGFKIDFEEISGKGVSMFMVNAVGTACKAKPVLAIKQQKNSNFLNEEEMEEAVHKFKFVEEIKSKERPRISDEAIDFFLEHPTKEIVDELLDFYYTVKLSGSEVYAGGAVYGTPMRIDANVNFIHQYIGLIQDSTIIEKVYSYYLKNDEFLKIIQYNGLFDSKQVLLVAEQDPIKAVKLLGISKDKYEKEDIGFFKQIVSKYDNLPNRGTFEMSKGGMFSKSQKQYICEHGHANDEGVEFCKQCGKNIQGLTKEDIQNIEDMKLKIDILEKYFG